MDMPSDPTIALIRDFKGHSLRTITSPVTAPTPNSHIEQVESLPQTVQ